MAESEFRQPVRKVQPASTAEQARVPASCCARIDELFGGYPLAQEYTHRIERTVIVVLRRTGADAAQNGEEVAPVRDPFGCPVPILDFLDVRALDVFPPAGTAQVCRQTGHHQRLVLMRLVGVVPGSSGSSTSRKASFG